MSQWSSGIPTMKLPCKVKLLLLPWQHGNPPRLHNLTGHVPILTLIGAFMRHEAVMNINEKCQMWGGGETLSLG